MVAPAYDHLTALVFACVLFVSAVVAVPAISYVNLLYVDQQQLRNVTLEALNSMLLGMGCPSNWGSINPFSESDITKFGLALSESSSFYVLDPDKVQRLNVENPSGSLDYETVRKRLELQGYGFNIRIMPLFNVAVDEWRIDNYLLFNVNVTLNERGPLPKASVTSTIFYVSGKRSDNFNFVTLPETKTNELGECTISYTLPFDFTGYILVLKVTAADMATVTVPYLEGFAQNVANVSIIGDTVSVSIPEDEHPSERTIYNVTVVTAEEVWNYPGVGCGRTPEDHMTWGEGYQYWTDIFPGLTHEDALFLVFNIYTQEEGSGPKHFVLFAASPLLNLASGVLQFGSPSAQSVNTAATKLCRSVEIAGMTYIFELLLWKEA
jgi:hypothetical protein